MLISVIILALVAQLSIRLECGKWDTSVWWIFIRSLTLEPSVLPRSWNQNATRLVLAVWSLVSYIKILYFLLLAADRSHFLLRECYSRFRPIDFAKHAKSMQNFVDGLAFATKVSV